MKNFASERYCNQSLDQHGRLPSNSGVCVCVDFVGVVSNCFLQVFCSFSPTNGDSRFA